MAVKTNVMRILQQQKIPFKEHSAKADPSLSAEQMAAQLGEDPARFFKTLVTVGHSGEHFVFMVPAPASLDLKKAAKAVGEKSIEMIAQKQLLPLTGYIHGGCSPIGMKKAFKTVIDAGCRNFEKIIFSAGRLGCFVELDSRLLPYETADISVY